MNNVRDLQHRFHVDGRTYVVEVCAPGRSAAPVTVGPFDVHIVADVPVDFDDYDGDAVESVVEQVADYVRPSMPPTIAKAEWELFKASLCGWICTHRTAAMIDDWNSERGELERSGELLDGSAN